MRKEWSGVGVLKEEKQGKVKRSCKRNEKERRCGAVCVISISLVFTFTFTVSISISKLFTITFFSVHSIPSASLSEII